MGRWEDFPFPLSLEQDIFMKITEISVLVSLNLQDYDYSGYRLR